MAEIAGKSKEGSLARARLDHCRALFEREWQRKELLEKKSQFYLSFATLFLGAILLKIEFIRQVRETLAGPETPDWARGAAYTAIVVFVAATFVCLFAVLESVRLRRYTDEAPFPAHEHLFAAGTLRDRAPEEEGWSNEEVYLDRAAFSYALAYDENRSRNERKSNAVWLGAASVFFMVLGFAILVGILVFLELSLRGR